MQKLSTKLDNIAIKHQYVQKLLNGLKAGEAITLIVKHSKGFRTITGTVETVYGDKFTYRDKGRIQMVTFGDLMSRDMRVKEG